MTDCCPPYSEGYLAPTYATIGTIETLVEGYQLYISASEPANKHAIVILPSIYGWNGGRTRHVSDYFSEAGYFSVVPQLLVPGLQGGLDGDGNKILGRKTVHQDFISTKYPRC